MSRYVYQVVTSTGPDPYVSRLFSSPAKIIKALHVKTTGITNQPYIRPELQNQPEFEGLAGPFWGGYDEKTGKPIIRYESLKVFRALSSD